MFRRQLHRARRVRTALRLSALVLVLVSFVLPDHVLTVLALAYSVFERRLSRLLRLL